MSKDIQEQLEKEIFGGIDRNFEFWLTQWMSQNKPAQDFNEANDFITNSELLMRYEVECSQVGDGATINNLMVLNRYFLDGAGWMIK